MTTRSSQERKKIQMDAGDLAIKFFKCIDLINQGKRSDSEIAILGQALQLFREGRLAGTVTKVVCEAKESSQGIAEDSAGKNYLERLQTILSFPVEESVLPVKLRFKCGQIGVVYLGEMLMLMNTSWMKDEEDVIREFFVSAFGTDISLEFGPKMALHWRPSYWDDSEYVRKLSLPLTKILETDLTITFWRFLKEVVRQNFENFYEKEQVYNDEMGKWRVKTPALKKFMEICTLGEIFELRSHRKQNLRVTGGWRAEYLTHIQPKLRPELNLHAGMFLPPNWSPPQRDEPLS